MPWFGAPLKQTPRQGFGGHVGSAGGGPRKHREVGLKRDRGEREARKSLCLGGRCCGRWSLSTPGRLVVPLRPAAELWVARGGGGCNLPALCSPFPSWRAPPGGNLGPQDVRLQVASGVGPRGSWLCRRCMLEADTNSCPDERLEPGGWEAVCRPHRPAARPLPSDMSSLPFDGAALQEPGTSRPGLRSGDRWTPASSPQSQT